MIIGFLMTEKRKHFIDTHSLQAATFVRKWGKSKAFCILVLKWVCIYWNKALPAVQSSDTVLYPVICQHRRSLRSAPITWTGAANIAADAGLSHLLTSFLAYFTKYCALMLRQLLCLVLANRGQRAAVTFIQFTAERCKCELEPQKGSKQVTLISCSRPQCTQKENKLYLHDHFVQVHNHVMEILLCC